MAITLRTMIEQTKDKYQLRQLSGFDALDHVVSWAHMAEDAGVSEFFWGNELVVTSGLLCRDSATLISFIDSLYEHRSVGVVINTGKYIAAVSAEVIDFCQSKSIPLFVMPWEKSITEFVRECCQIIGNSNRDDRDLAAEIIDCINYPAESGKHEQSLGEYFRLEDGFLLLAVEADAADFDAKMRENTNRFDQRRTLRIHTAMQKFSFPYLIFPYNKRFFILINTTDQAAAYEAAQKVYETSRSIFQSLSIYIGVGDAFAGIDQLADCYLTAISAVRQASLQKIPVVRFEKMGFYRILYSVPRDTLLKEYYEDTLGPLLEYDRKHSAGLVETLIRYILSDGSVQQVAAEMFTHRNTVNYRMVKIRELLGNPLATPGDYLPYLIAYHSGVILREVLPFSGGRGDRRGPD